MATIIVRVKGITENGELIEGEIVIDDPAVDDVAEDGNELDIVEYYRRRLPLTVEAMGL